MRQPENHCCVTGDSVNTILITGATGYLGSLVAAALAADRSARLVLLIRGKRDFESVVARIVAEVARIGTPRNRPVGDRITVIAMPDPLNSAEVVQALQRFPIREIIHCAGALSYWNIEKLKAGNVRLTEELLEAGRRLGVRRFIYLSSAFCSGYVDGVVGEHLHAGPGTDPCPYTASKRETELLVARSGLPYLMVRPSIVIGDSRDGCYTGKLSGLYQLLWAAKRYLFGRKTVVHAVTPDVPLPVLHQDAFQAGFLSAYQHSPDNAFIHLVSRDETLPTVHQLWDTIIDRYLTDCDIRYYEHPSEIPMEECDGHARQFWSAVRTNMEICSHRWRFESTALESLRTMGPPFGDASLPTVTMCQDQFLETIAKSVGTGS